MLGQLGQPAGQRPRAPSGRAAAPRSAAARRPELSLCAAVQQHAMQQQAAGTRGLTEGCAGSAGRARSAHRSARPVRRGARRSRPSRPRSGCSSRCSTSTSRRRAIAPSSPRSRRRGWVSSSVLWRRPTAGCASSLARCVPARPAFSSCWPRSRFPPAHWAEAALGRADDEQMHVVLAGAGHQRRSVAATADRLGDVGQHRAHPLGIGTRRFRGLLGTTQLRRGDHLHRLGDFLRRLDGGDAVTKVF